MTAEKKVESLQADVDKIKVELQVMNEMRKAAGEQNARIEEQVGELRGMLSDREREMREMQVNVTKSVEMLSQIKPEKIIVDMQKQNAKIEIVEARIKSYHKISEKIMADFKKMRREMAPFKGVSQLIKLRESVRNDLDSVTKIKNLIDRHANEAEKILIKIESKYTEFTRYKKLAERMEAQFNEALKEVDVIKVDKPQKKGFSFSFLKKKQPEEPKKSEE